MKIIKFLFSRLVIVGLILVIQVVWLINLLVNLGNYSNIINAAFTILSLIVVLWLINKRDNPAYKLAWTIPILIFPLLGGLLYLSIGDKKPSRGLRNKLNKVLEETKPYIVQDQEIMEELQGLDRCAANQSRYITDYACYPIHKNTSTEYYKSGEEMFEVMKREMKKAKHYIFLEFFIVEEGVMWDSMLDILKEKVKEGVEVRFVYDDMGCLSLLPHWYYKKLEYYGIKCMAFNPFVPVFSLAMNNRDHRKILVVDGHTAFSGGLNLADEYINVKERFGYWKDTGFMIKGDAVWNFTIMFLQLWNAFRPEDHDYNRYKPHVHHPASFESDGFVQPYSDSPLDHEAVGENVYLNIINAAEHYVNIFTPYLVIDNEMMTALCLAAKRGVEVCIVTPNIPDKKYVFLLSQSYYLQLVESGVKIYQYKPGFIHAKCFVADDKIATVGTINLDYRSLYLHFECGVFFYKSKLVRQVREDMIETINQSIPITEEMCKKGLIMRIIQGILRVFAPMM